MSFTKQNKYNILRLRDVEILCRGKENCPTFYTLKKIYLNGHPVNVKEKYKYKILHQITDIFIVKNPHKNLEFLNSLLVASRGSAVHRHPVVMKSLSVTNFGLELYSHN